MWRVEEHRRIGKQLASAPIEIQKRYERWLDVATISGPPGLRALRGLHDESLAGAWSGYRSSRLNIQYQVIYRLVAADQLFQIIEVTPHDYRRR